MSLGIEMLIEIVGYTCEFVMQLLCIHGLLGKKLRFELKSVMTGIIFVVILLIPMCLPISKLFTLLAHVAILIYVLLKFKLNIINSILVILLNILISGSVQIIGTFLIKFIYKIISNEYIIFLCIQIFSLILMSLVNKIVKLNKIYRMTTRWDKTIIKALSMILMLFMYLYVKYKTEEKMMIFAYFISALMVCIAIKIILNWNKDRDEVKRKTLELHMHELYGKTFEAMIENIRIRQHDFKNQLAAIYGMHLTAENFEELVEDQKKYCDYLMKESRYDSILTKCNDKILAGFLYSKLTECEKQGVDIRFSILLNDSKCKLATYELIEITGILIDNATEVELTNKFNNVVDFVLEDEESGITIICINQSEYLSMEQINQFFEKGYSTKGDGRGLGLYNVKKLLEGKGELYVSNKCIDKENYIEFKITIER